MFKLSLFLLTLSLLSHSIAAQNCGIFCVRKEWRRLTLQQRSTYVSAVVQLRNRNPAGYQSYPNTHVSLGNSGIHNSAQFLPWHRFFLIQYETSLRAYSPGLCMAYWDAVQDRTNLAISPVFDATTGFGALSAGCVAFAGMPRLTENNGPCVTRTNERSRRIDPIETINRLVSSNNFAAFSSGLEVGYHSAVHISLGGSNGNFGQMSTYNSPADPIFFLHHAFVDRLWALWQSLDFSRRLNDLSYRTNFFNFDNINTNLVGTGSPASRYMDISILCYRYEDVNVKPGTRAVRRRSLERRAPPPGSPPPTTTAATPVRGKDVDLGEVGLLVKLEPLPDFWIKMNKYDKNYVEQCEANKNNIIDQLNNLDGYLSVSSRASNVDYIKSKLAAEPGATRVIYTVKGQRRELPVRPGDCDATARDVARDAQNIIMKRRPRGMPRLLSVPGEGSTGKSLQVPVDPVEAKLASIIGGWALGGTLDPNPYAAVSGGLPK